MIEDRFSLIVGRTGKMKKFAIALIRFYQKNISPLKRPCCKYYPTCSEYGVTAFEEHGFIKGFVLTFYRILRCNPFAKGGYDPVPEKNSVKLKKYR